MATFVVIPANDRAVANLATNVPARVPGASYRLPRGEWLVKFDGTSQQLAQLLGVLDESNEQLGIVLSFGGYFGRSDPAIWEWITVNQAK
jgi:hypothetical protein